MLPCHSGQNFHGLVDMIPYDIYIYVFPIETLVAALGPVALLPHRLPSLIYKYLTLSYYNIRATNLDR